MLGRMGLDDAIERERANLEAEREQQQAQARKPPVSRRRWRPRRVSTFSVVTTSSLTSFAECTRPVIEARRA
jgi:hypothetical protein